ncbi:MAG: hypothetical protein Q9187_005064 [Circinaria calcarea]
MDFGVLESSRQASDADSIHPQDDIRIYDELYYGKRNYSERRRGTNGASVFLSVPACPDAPTRPKMLRFEMTEDTRSKFGQSTKSCETCTSPENQTIPKSIPEISSPRYTQLRFAVFTVYHRLFSIIFILNAIAFAVILSRNPRYQTAFVNAATANILITGLARHPLVLNTIFFGVSLIPRSSPLWIRRLAAKTYHYGGVHSGCGVAAVVWYIGFVAIATRDVKQLRPLRIPPSLVLAYIILILLLLILVAAYPRLRFRHHDLFEFTHRFSVWMVIPLFWALLIVLANDTKVQNSLGYCLSHLPAFWMVIIITMAIVHPWLHLRRVKVTPEYISPHAMRLHFDYTSIKVGQGISISNHPFRDWHSFAVFPDLPPGHSQSKELSAPKTFSCLVSKAGDWTGNCILQPPTRIWKRSVPVSGYGTAMSRFRRLVVVTTGSGIGPCLSLLAEPDRPPTRILWQTRSPLRTYGQGILDAVALLDPDARVIDSDRAGRCEMLPVVWETVQAFEAEAVVVVSNPSMTRRLVYELEARGVLAYGPIWDS